MDFATPLTSTVYWQEDRLVRINHTDPWVRSDAWRTSRTLGLQTTRSSGTAIHGRASDDVILRCSPGHN